MKIKKSKLIIGFIIFILFISLASSCGKKNKDTSSETSSTTAEDNNDNEITESNSDLDDNDNEDENSAAEEKVPKDSENNDTKKSVNDYPDFINLIDNSHPASKIQIHSSVNKEPKSVCESKDYYYILAKNSVYRYRKDTGEFKDSFSFDFVNEDFKPEENTKKDSKKDSKKSNKKQDEKSRDYNTDTIDAIAASENNLWVCHSSSKTSTITKFHLPEYSITNKLSSKYSFNLRGKCDFLAFDNEILWAGENKSHGACSIQGYSVNDNHSGFLSKDPHYKYRLTIPNYIDSAAVHNNRFFLHEHTYTGDDSHIYIFDNVNLENANLDDLSTASKTITLPKRSACLTYSQDRLVTVFNTYWTKDKDSVINHACPLIV